MQSCLALRFLVKRENGGSRGRLMNIYIHHVFSKCNIYRRLDFSINANNYPISRTSSGTTLCFGENSPSCGIIKRTIEAVSPSDSNVNVDTSVSIESPVQKAPRRSLQPRRSPRLALKALKGVLVKRRKQAEERLQEKAVKDLH